MEMFDQKKNQIEILEPNNSINEMKNSLKDSAAEWKRQREESVNWKTEY